RVPEDAESPKIRMSPLDQWKIGDAFGTDRRFVGGTGCHDLHRFGFRDRVCDQPPIRRKLPLQLLLADYRGHSIVDAKDLMVSSDDLPRAAGAAVVEQDEVFDKVE